MTIKHTLRFSSINIDSIESSLGVPTNLLNSPDDLISIDLDTNLNGQAYKIVNNNDNITFSSQNAVLGDIDHSESDSLLLILPSSEKIAGGLLNIVNQEDDSPDSVDWVVSDNITLRRSNNGGLYNITAGQLNWSGDNATGTLWRNDTNQTQSNYFKL